ncbi:MAG: ligand-binding sensor domain-containing protein/signal transduction histidine kinase [Phenylobacterium sp.]|jgi:ligand-binding sensor domain-containing protein/signal transduction histidine kinase
MKDSNINKMNLLTPSTSRILPLVKNGFGQIGGLILTLWLLLFASSGLAKSYYSMVENISVDQGLPDSTVFSLAKDQTGFLWIGMPTALARYDGYQFRTFSKNSKEDSPLVLDGAANIFIDSRQRIWIGSWGEGLALYDRNMTLIGYFRHNKEDPESIGSNLIQTIFEDSDGDIWVGTNGGGLALYQEKTQSFISYRHNPRAKSSLSHNRVWSITETAKGVIWIATSDGLNKLNKKMPGRFSHYKHNPKVSTSLNHVLVRSLLADKDGNLWVGTEAGFGRFDTTSKHFTEINLSPSKEPEPVSRMIEDPNGSIWIGTKRGVFRYEPNKPQLTPLANESHFQLFPHNDIRDMLIDNSGVLWLATRYAGLIKVNLASNRFSYYPDYTDDQKVDNLINKVHVIHTDQRGTVWMGIGDKLLKMNTQTKAITRVKSPKKLGALRVRGIAETTSGKLWFGGTFGLLSLDPQSNTFTDESELLADQKIKLVRTIKVDAKDNLWVGLAHEGLVKISPEREVSHYQHNPDEPNSISGNAIFTLFIDKQQRLWIGTAGSGVSRYNRQTNNFTRYIADSRQPCSLSDNVINTIYQSQDGQMWFGTPKSLDRLDENLAQFVHYGPNDGLINSHIKGIIEDDLGDLWISTDNGLSQFNHSLQTFTNFSQRDSLQNDQFLPSSVAKSHSGQLYFGGNRGVHEVMPSQVQVKKQAPTVVITDVWIDDKAIERLTFDGNTPLILNHSVKSLRFRYAALDFQRAGKNRYSYQFEGLDDVWHGPSENRMVVFTNLSPGKYNFAVRGSNRNGQWDSKSYSLPVTVLPPWWQLWWFRVVMAVVFMIGLYGWNRFRLLTIAGNKKLIEVEVAVRTSQIYLQKDELIEEHHQLEKRAKAMLAENKELTQSLEKNAEYQKQQMEEQKMAALGSMVASISHEINTPIGLGITATSLMQDRLAELKISFADEKLSAKQLKTYLNEGEESLAIIYRNLERAADMIRSFKQVSVDQSKEESRTFGMLQLINEVLFSMQTELNKVRHQVEVICDNNIRIKSKPGPLNQILINLITNSLTHAFDGIEKGLMTIQVTISGNHCQLVYRDNGIGVSGHIEEHLFEPFVSSKNQQGISAGKGGTGLGMHLVYKLATQGLGGSITLNKEAESGIEFTVVFPVMIESDVLKGQGHESLLI